MRLVIEDLSTPPSGARASPQGAPAKVKLLLEHRLLNGKPKFLKTKPAIIDTHTHFYDQGDLEFDLEWSWPEAGTAHPILGGIDPIKAIRFDFDAVEAESPFADVEGFVHI